MTSQQQLTHSYIRTYAGTYYASHYIKLLQSYVLFSSQVGAAMSSTMLRALVTQSISWTHELRTYVLQHKTTTLNLVVHFFDSESYACGPFVMTTVIASREQSPSKHERCTCNTVSRVSYTSCEPPTPPWGQKCTRSVRRNTPPISPHTCKGPSCPLPLPLVPGLFLLAFQTVLVVLWAQLLHSVLAMLTAQGPAQQQSDEYTTIHIVMQWPVAHFPTGAHICNLHTYIIL